MLIGCVVVGNVRGGYGSPQPHFPQQGQFQPHPQQFPHQPHRTPSSGYAQPHQPQQQHHPHVGVQQQQQQQQQQQGSMPNAGVPADMGDEAK